MGVDKKCVQTGQGVKHPGFLIYQIFFCKNLQDNNYGDCGEKVEVIACELVLFSTAGDRDEGDAQDNDKLDGEF